MEKVAGKIQNKKNARGRRVKQMKLKTRTENLIKLKIYVFKIAEITRKLCAHFVFFLTLNTYTNTSYKCVYVCVCKQTKKCYTFFSSFSK